MLLVVGNTGPVGKEPVGCLRPTGVLGKARCMQLTSPDSSTVPRLWQRWSSIRRPQCQALVFTPHFPLLLPPVSTREAADIPSPCGSSSSSAQCHFLFLFPGSLWLSSLGTILPQGQWSSSCPEGVHGCFSTPHPASGTPRGMPSPSTS